MSYLCRGNSYGWPLDLVSTLEPFARASSENVNNVPDYTFYNRGFYLIHQLVFLNVLIQNKNHIRTIALKRILFCGPSFC